MNHLIALTDDVGVIQHAVEDVPNRSTGYCTDDVSRAFMVVLAKLEIDPADATADRMATGSIPAAVPMNCLLLIRRFMR